MNTPSVDDPGDDRDDFTVRQASRIPIETVAWLWPGRIPAGKLTLIEGDPATAKSTLSLDIAARVTRGAPWPDGTPGRHPAAVLLLSAEDGWGDTIRPRLEAAGADLDRCICVAARDVDGEYGPLRRPIVLPDDIAWIAGLTHTTNAALVVIDVLAAYLADRIDAHKDQSVRRLLAQLATAAAHTGAAVVMLRHHNKAVGGPAMYRGGGSIGLIGAARAAHAVIRDPDDPDHRLLATIKSNLATEAPTWGYTLTDVPHLGVARITWDPAPDPRTATELLAGGTSAALDDAVTWLTDWRKTHPGEVPSAQLTADAASAGISPTTLHRARKQLGLRSRRHGDGWSVS